MVRAGSAEGPAAMSSGRIAGLFWCRKTGWPEGRRSCWFWRSDADGNATWGPTSRPVPQWTRPGATPVETLGRHGHHH